MDLELDGYSSLKEIHGLSTQWGDGLPGLISVKGRLPLKILHHMVPGLFVLREWKSCVFGKVLSPRFSFSVLLTPILHLNSLTFQWVLALLERLQTKGWVWYLVQIVPLSIVLMFVHLLMCEIYL